MINPNPAPREAAAEVASRLMGTLAGNRIDSSTLVHLDVPDMCFSSVEKGTQDLLVSLDTVLGRSTSPQQNAVVGFRKPFDNSMPHLIGALHEGAFPSANFDYTSNPAAAEGESLVCEMVRKLIGLHDQYSLKSHGLGKIAVTLNEVLLLCYHSTVYTHPQEVEAKLVFYTTARDLDELQKFLSVRNNINFRALSAPQENSSFDELLKELTRNIERDKQAGLIPHFLHYRIRSISDLQPENLKKLHHVVQQNKILMLIDASELGVQALRELGFQHVDADFVALDLSQLAGPSSHLFFLKERLSFREKLVNVPMECLKTYSDLTGVQKRDVSSEATRICDAEFTAHDYNIGFGNFVPWERLMLLFRCLGKKGIRQAVATQTKNLDSLDSVLKKQAWVSTTIMHSAYVEVHLHKEGTKQLESEPKALLQAEIGTDAQGNPILKCFVPCLSELTGEQLESGAHHLGGSFSRP